jgi:cytochrome-b5 reductase
MFIKANIKGKEEMRQYTPITSDEHMGYFDLIIKVYFAGVHPKFPEGGKLTQYMEAMKIGDTIDVMGPKGRFHYVGRGKYTIGGAARSGSFKKLGMVAGGSGITPMLQVLRAIVRDPEDKTQVWLLFGNQTEADILCRKEIEEYARDYPGRFQYAYTLDRPPAGWTGQSGFVDDKMLETTMPPPGPDTFITLCGPPPMVNMACKPNLKKLGHADENVFAF